MRLQRLDVFRSLWGLERRLTAPSALATLLRQLKAKGYTGVEASLADARAAFATAMVVPVVVVVVVVALPVTTTRSWRRSLQRCGTVVWSWCWGRNRRGRTTSATRSTCHPQCTRTAFDDRCMDAVCAWVAGWGYGCALWRVAPVKGGWLSLLGHSEQVELGLRHLHPSVINAHR